MSIEFTTETAPTLRRFMKSNAYGRLIAGPVGSGKTIACVMELLRRSIQQSPGGDGLRHTRFAIVRQTLKQLKDTVLKDCKSWLTEICDYRVSENTLHINLNDVRSEWILIPLEDAEDQARLLSMQLTGAWLSEAIEMDISVLAPLSGRIGRYPSGREGNPSWYGLIGDTNMPSEGSSWHKFMTEPPPDWDIFIQPSGLSALAENLPNLLQSDVSRRLPSDHPTRIALGQKYYQRFVDMYGIDSDWVRRYVKAEFGDDPSGTAVFRTSFTYSFHVVPDLTPVPGYPIIIGQDFGRDPWSIISQMDHLGRLNILEEIPGTGTGTTPTEETANRDDIGLEQHIIRNLRPRLLQQRYHGMKIAMVGDPAGAYKTTITEETSIDVLKRLGFNAFPAPTNDLDPRIRSVESFLLRQVGGGPALRIDKDKCPMLVRALNGGYRFSRTKGGDRKPKPDKGPHSHVVDALQYVCLVAGGGMLPYVVSNLTPRRRHTPKFTEAAWT